MARGITRRPPRRPIRHIRPHPYLESASTPDTCVLCHLIEANRVHQTVLAWGVDAISRSCGDTVRAA